MPRNVWIFILSILGLVIIGVIIFIIFRYKEVEIQELETPGPALFEPVKKS